LSSPEPFDDNRLKDFCQNNHVWSGSFLSIESLVSSLDPEKKQQKDLKNKRIEDKESKSTFSQESFIQSTKQPF